MFLRFRLNYNECEQSGGIWTANCNSSGCGSYYCDCEIQTSEDGAFARKFAENNVCVNCNTTNCPTGVLNCDQGREICHETSMSCENGICMTRTTEHPNKSCGTYYYNNQSTEYKHCFDTCGDGVCKSPETKTWCPVDCL